jgi:outer membrane protein insertion porin family
MGFVTVAMNNLFGTARSGRVSWRKDNRNSQEISLSYKEPWIFNIPVNLEGSFFQRQQDTMYLRRDVEGRIRLLVDENISLGGLINHEVIIPSVNNGVTLVSSSRMMTAGIDIRYDTRDDPVSPASGIQYQSEYRIGNKKIFNAVGFAVSGVTTLQRVSVDLQFFTPVLSRNVLMIGLHGRQITNSQVEVSDLYRFGGTNSLRGYREYEFTGSRVAWTNTEYRFVMARRSLLYGFFDTGYYFLPAENNGLIPSQQKVKYGYGVGMRIETSLGNVGISFALGEGDSFSEGKIHFGLMNEF